MDEVKRQLGASPKLGLVARLARYADELKAIAEELVQEKEEGTDMEMPDDVNASKALLDDDGAKELYGTGDCLYRNKDGALVHLQTAVSG